MYKIGKFVYNLNFVFENLVIPNRKRGLEGRGGGDLVMLLPHPLCNLTQITLMQVVQLRPTCTGKSPLHKITSWWILYL